MAETVGAVVLKVITERAPFGTATRVTLYVETQYDQPETYDLLRRIIESGECALSLFAGPAVAGSRTGSITAVDERKHHGGRRAEAAALQPRRAGELDAARLRTGAG